MNRLLLLLFALSPGWLSAQSLRTDLQSVLPKLLCKGNKSIPTSRELWKIQLHETQLDAAWIRSAEAAQPLILEDVATIAREQAQVRQHQGYAYGLCSTHEAWILSTPAAAPLTTWTPDGLKVNLKIMQERCERVALHYAEAGHGLPKQIKKMETRAAETIFVHPELLKPGTLGLTCYPLDKKQGPELWSLMPVQKVRTDRIPHFTSHHREGTEGLIQWIQDIRKAQGLKVLKTEIPLLRNFANQLVADPSIRHPHAKLLAQKRLLAKRKINILGENRVKATTNEQMAWLLWFSPTHRQLLLHKKATALGFDVARLQHEKLLVLVLAKI